MALPLNLNAKNLPNADFFLVFKIYVYFLWASASKLQPKTSAKNLAVLKEEENKVWFQTLIYLSVALGLTDLLQASSSLKYKYLKLYLGQNNIIGQ